MPPTIKRGISPKSIDPTHLSLDAVQLADGYHVFKGCQNVGDLG